MKARIIFPLLLFSFNSFAATLISRFFSTDAYTGASVGSSAEKSERVSFSGTEIFTETETKTTLWLLPQIGLRSGISTSLLQEIIRQFLLHPHFPNGDAIYNYILQKPDFLKIHDKFLLINFITNHTHFAQTFSNKYNISQEKFEEIISQAKNDNIFNENLKNHILESYSAYSEIDKNITNKPNINVEKSIHNLKNEEKQALLYSRLYVLGNNRYKKFYQLTNKQNITSEMLLYDKILYHHQRKNNDEILKYLKELPPTLENSAHWWKASKQIVWDLLDANHKEEAYGFLSKIYLPKSHPNYTQKEMLNGALAMLTSNASYAYEHFYNVYENANNIAEKAQGAYFLALYHKNARSNQAYNFWINKATKHPTTYYGLMAISNSSNIFDEKITGSSSYLTEQWHKNNAKSRKVYKKYLDDFITTNIIKKQQSYQNLPTHILEMLEIAQILKQNGYFEHAKSFLINAVTTVEDLTFMQSLLQYICTNYNRYICMDAQVSAQKIGFIDISSFKIINSTSIEKTILRNHLPLLHSIIKQESNFKEIATSRAGAQGMMQIMPGTAKVICTTHDIPYNHNKLKNDAEYNIMLGTMYINDLLEKYQGSYAKSLISYNAGWGNLHKWETRYLQPKTQEEASLMIELIPFNETRNYVKQILTREAIYDYILNSSLAVKIIE